MEGMGNFFFFFTSTIRKKMASLFTFSNKSFIKVEGKPTLNVKKMVMPVFIIQFSKILFGIRSMIKVARLLGYSWSRG